MESYSMHTFIESYKRNAWNAAWKIIPCMALLSILEAMHGISPNRMINPLVPLSTKNVSYDVIFFILDRGIGKVPAAGILSDSGLLLPEVPV